MTRFCVALLTTLILTPIALSQQLSTEVYPSEDELSEALVRGEIDYEQYRSLMDIIDCYPESSLVFLLDEIPNLAFFLFGRKPLRTELQAEQQAAITDTAGVIIPRLRITHRYGLRADEDATSRFRTTIDINAGGGWRAFGAVHGEYGDIERVTRRGLVYYGRESILNELRLGNFTTRFGMGTVIGNHGRLFDFSENIDGESILFPDCGGYNGLLARAGAPVGEAAFLVSQNRDGGHHLQTAAVSLGPKGWLLTPELVVGYNRLTNRVSDAAVNDGKGALTLTGKYRGGYIRAEVAAQFGTRAGPGALTFEGRHRFRQAQLTFAGWSYSDDYLDLTAGSKAANLRRTSHLEEIDFNYSDKRSCQSGGMMKTIVLLSSNATLTSAVIAGFRGNDTLDFELLTGVIRNFGERVSLRLDHLSRTKKRATAETAGKSSSGRTRLEMRFWVENVRTRTYIAHNTRSGRGDFLTLFVNLKLADRRCGNWEVWSSADRIDPGLKSLDYWYGFLRNELPAAGSVSIGSKLSHTYRRGTAKSHVTTLSIEVRVLL